MTNFRKGTEEWKQAMVIPCQEDLATLTENPFIRDAEEIKGYCYEQGVDTGVGLDIYIMKHYPTKEEKEGIDEEHIRQYKDMCRKYYLDYIVDVQKMPVVEVEKTE